MFTTISKWMMSLMMCYRPPKGLDPSKIPQDPLSQAGLLSATFFTWASGLIHTGMQRPLQLHDIWSLPTQLTAADALLELKGSWEGEVSRAATTRTPPSFHAVVWRFVRRDMLYVFLWKMGWLGFGLVSNCYLLRALVIWLASPPSQQDLATGLLLAAGFFLAETARSICVNRHWLLAVLIGVRLRAGARQLLYEKSLRLRGAHSSQGTLVQLISGDTGRLLEGCNYSEFLLSTPITVGAALGLMLWLIGPPALAGFAILGAYLPLQWAVAGRLGAVRRTTAAIADERTGVMGEILAGMRLLKLYAYEGAFAGRVGEIRGREVGALRSAAVLRAINTTAAISITVLVLLAVFATFMLTASPALLRPEVAFTVVALFNIARFPLGVLPQATRCFTEAGVACTRIQAFLCLPEGAPGDCPVALPLLAPGKEEKGMEVLVEGGGSAAAAAAPAPAAKVESPPALTNDAAGGGGAGGAFAPIPSTASIAARGATYVWASALKPRASASASGGSGGVSKEDAVVVSLGGGGGGGDGVTPPTPNPSPTFLLPGIHNLTFTIPTGTLTAVVGPVGCGKSSLLEALLGLLSHHPHPTSTSSSGGGGGGGVVGGGGRLYTRGRIAYAPQVPWVYAGTFKENVCFSSPGGGGGGGGGELSPKGVVGWDPERYAAVLWECGLSGEVAGFPAGDATELGERGINLSGGQKARLGLARALYAGWDREIFLLDDVLSALDAGVAAHVWKHAVQGRLRREGKTVLLVTHAIHLLSGDSCDSVLAMRAGGGLEAFGAFKDVFPLAAAAAESAAAGVGGVGVAAGAASGVGVGLEETPSEMLVVVPPTPSHPSSSSSSSSSPTTPSITVRVVVGGEEPEQQNGKDTPPPSHVNSTLAATPNPSPSPIPTPTTTSAQKVDGGGKGEGGGAAAVAAASKGTLTVAEDRTLGSVKGATWLLYFRHAGGLWMLVAVAALLLVGKGSVLIASFVLSFWTSSSASAAATDAAVASAAAAAAGGGAASSSSSTAAATTLNHALVLSQYLPAYAGVCGAVVALNALQGLLFAAVTTGASRSLHGTVFSSVMRGTVGFFDSQPPGRVLSRFAGDMDILDTVLPGNLEACAEFLTQCALAVVLIIAVFPTFLPPAAAMCALFAALTAAFRTVARELKRVDSVSRGPLLAHVTSTPPGLPTITAWGCAPAFAARNAACVDTQSRTYWALYASNRWLAIRVDVLTSATAAITAALVVAFRGSLSPGSAALALTTALSLAGTLQFSVRLTTECESAFTAVERLGAYTEGGGVVIPEQVVVGGKGYSVEEAKALVPPHVAAAAAAAAAAGGNATAGDAAAAALTTDAIAILPLSSSGGGVGKGAEAAAVAAAAAAAAATAAVKFRDSHSTSSTSFTRSTDELTQPQWFPASWLPPLLAAQWPWEGRVEFIDYTTSYRPHLPPVLKGVSFAVEGGTSVGVVGRTGSGKTSLTLALFRVLEAGVGVGVGVGGGGGGKILIDGVDISRVNIHHLRSRLAIIPQDPTLFTGTLRSNLDMFGVHTSGGSSSSSSVGGGGGGGGSRGDELLTSCARAAGLGGLLESSPLGLDTPVAEGGKNLSVGQRQLVCLARALLRGAKVLVMDEASASLDEESDRLLGQSLRERFQGCTKVIVAHRLKTVIGCHRVLGMREGRVVDFDTPRDLLRNPGSLLSSLVAGLGGGEAEALRGEAERGPHK